MISEKHFDFDRFSRAMEIGAVDYVSSRYASNAHLQLMNPDSPPGELTELTGRAAIKAWREGLWVDYATHSVVKYLSEGDRLLFVEQRVHYEGMVAVASSTAELTDGLISAQFTTTVWDRGHTESSDAWPGH